MTDRSLLMEKFVCLVLMYGRCAGLGAKERKALSLSTEKRSFCSVRLDSPTQVLQLFLCVWGCTT